MQLRNTVFVLSLAAVLGLSAPVGAQEAQSGQAQARAAAQQSIEVSDQQLEQFAEAQIEIAGIQQEFSGRLQAVEDPDKARDIQREANQEMTTAVENAGLDVQSFNQIAMAIQNDPELQQDLTTMLQARQQQ